MASCAPSIAVLWGTLVCKPNILACQTPAGNSDKNTPCWVQERNMLGAYAPTNQRRQEQQQQPMGTRTSHAGCSILQFKAV
eukprot:scaffold137319_cov20-Tisochrysis_lutea.AAC.3